MDSCAENFFDPKMVPLLCPPWTKSQVSKNIPHLVGIYYEIKTIQSGSIP